MIACGGPATFVAFALFFALALVLMRLGLPRNTAVTHDFVPLVRAQTPPYDWEREGI